MTPAGRFSTTLSLGRAIPRILSGGVRWIYPIGSGLIFYALWSLGGYAALSYFAAGCAATTTALLLRKGSTISLLLAVVAIPAIVARSTVRADTFSTILT